MSEIEDMSQEELGFFIITKLNEIEESRDNVYQNCSEVFWGGHPPEERKKGIQAMAEALDNITEYCEELSEAIEQME